MIHPWLPNFQVLGSLPKVVASILLWIIQKRKEEAPPPSLNIVFIYSLLPLSQIPHICPCLPVSPFICHIISCCYSVGCKYTFFTASTRWQQTDAHIRLFTAYVLLAWKRSVPVCAERMLRNFVVTICDVTAPDAAFHRWSEPPPSLGSSSPSHPETLLDRILFTRTSCYNAKALDGRHMSVERTCAGSLFLLFKWINAPVTY